jgi:hypothetical protein
VTGAGQAVRDPRPSGWGSTTAYGCTMRGAQLDLTCGGMPHRHAQQKSPWVVSSIELSRGSPIPSVAAWGVWMRSGRAGPPANRLVAHRKTIPARDFHHRPETSTIFAASAPPLNSSRPRDSQSVNCGGRLVVAGGPVNWAARRFDDALGGLAGTDRFRSFFPSWFRGG